jgi:hypothetical protein
MFFAVPRPIVHVGKRYRVWLDVALGAVTKMGGVTVGDATEMRFFEDGTVRCGSTEVARYRPAVPLHVEFVVSVPERTVTATVNKHKPLTIPWRRPKAGRFWGVRLDGLLPGGHARPGKIAFDNVRITLMQ